MLLLLSIVLLAVHLLSMNLAAAGPVVAVWMRLRGDVEPLIGVLGRRLGWWSIGGLLVGIVTGVLQWLALPGAGVRAATARIPTRDLWFAGMELVFSLTCLGVVMATWNRAVRWRWPHVVPAVLSATNLLYHFPPLMVIVGRLSVEPHWAGVEEVNRSTFLRLLARGEVLSLTAHFVLASFAVATVAALWLVARVEGAGESMQTGSRGRERFARRAGALALLTTLLQVPVGLWVFLALPAHSRDALVGDSLVAALAFFLGLALAVSLVKCLTLVALGEVGRGRLRQAALLLLAIVLLMTAGLRLSRDAQRPAQVAARLTQAHTAPVTADASSRNKSGLASREKMQISTNVQMVLFAEEWKH